MPTLLIFALGGVLFSILLSLFLVIRNTIRDKSDYEKWLDDVKRDSVVEPRRRYSSL